MKPSFKKTIFLSFLVIIVVLSNMHIAIMGAVQTSIPLPFHGVLSYEQLPDNILPLTGLGGDYSLTYDNGDVELWIDWGWINKAVAYKPQYHTVRLGFNFIEGVSGISTFDYKTFDRVLQIFDDAGLKVIAVNQNAHPDFPNNYAFSSEFRNSWIDFVTYYKDDNRIAALSLLGETVPSQYEGHTAYEVTNAYAELTRDIHAIDPDRVIIFPLGGLYYNSATQWISDLRAIGIVNEAYTVFDVVHPYFFQNEWDMGLTPEQKAVWYSENWILPCASALGASRCYSGETFAWHGTINGTPSDDDLQIRWLTAIINEFEKYGIGFTVWAILGDKESFDLNAQGIAASNYT
jgi:hypothetical protein